MKFVLLLKRNILLLLLILLASSLRFYKLTDYMTFLGDEGRDAIVVKRILTERHFVLLGPPMSVGNLYLGPLYYYMMASSMLVFWLNPVGAAAMNALVGTLTVVLIFLLAKDWFNTYGAFWAAFFYAISPINIIHSRSSWNPNPNPFFSLLALSCFYLCIKKKDSRFLILTGIFAAFAFQMHYWAIILITLLILLWLQTFIDIKRRILKIQGFYTNTILGTISFFLLMSPLLIFDLRHKFMNYHAFYDFFINKDKTFSLSISNILSRAWDIYINKLIGNYMTGDSLISLVLGLCILGFLIFYSIFKSNWQIKTLGIWIAIGIIGLTLYKGEVYDHYLGSINPAPYICLSGLLTMFKRKTRLIGIVLILLIAFLNLKNSPLLSPPSKQLEKTQKIAKFVIEKSENKPFNFALIAGRNYDSAYQYYLDIYKHKPKQLPFEITSQLLVVCEDRICNPIGHRKYEIAAFGWSKKDLEFDIDGVKIYKLVHFK